MSRQYYLYRISIFIYLKYVVAINIVKRLYPVFIALIKVCFRKQFHSANILCFIVNEIFAKQIHIFVSQNSVLSKVCYQHHNQTSGISSRSAIVFLFLMLQSK